MSEKEPKLHFGFTEFKPAGDDPKIVVPEGMVVAILDSARYLDTGRRCLTQQQAEEVGADVCRWMSKNPIIPTWQQWQDMSPQDDARDYAVEWQRRMFIALEPEVPVVDHRWNVRVEDGKTEVCRVAHDRSEGCRWEPWPPAQQPPEPELPEFIEMLGVKWYPASPEVPSGVKSETEDFSGLHDILLSVDAPDASRPTRDYYNFNVIEGYRRGQRSKQ